MTSGAGGRRPPFHAAEAYIALGWEDVLALPPGKKGPPPEGFTGAAKRAPTPADRAEWRAKGLTNIALRLPHGIIGIDVDAYGAKVGEETLDRLLEELGDLPETWVSTSRDDNVSGIYLYRVPAGQVRAGGQVGPDIDLIRRGHRYAVVAPSVHPEGRVYRWIRPDGEFAARGEYPPLDEIPELPAAWLAHLTDRGEFSGRTSAPPGSRKSRRRDDSEAQAWLDGLPETEACPYVARIRAEGLSSARRENGSAHDAVRDDVLALLRAAECGHQGVPESLRAIGEQFVTTVRDRAGKDSARAEFDQLVLGGARMILADPTESDGRRCTCSASERVSSWAPVDLVPILNGTVSVQPATVMPRTDGVALLYAGHVNEVHGESESGKSFVVQAVAARLLSAGRKVLYLDFESGPAAVVGRLCAMGCSADEIANHLDYRRPEGRPDASEWAELTDTEYDLTVIDGVTDALGIWAKSTKDNDEVAAWLRDVARPLAHRSGAAVVLVDHVVKSVEGRGRFAIGAQAKLAGLDGASYIVEVEQVIGRGLRGVIVLRIAKDRPGSVRPHCGIWRKADRTQEAARVVIDSRDGERTLVEFQPPARIEGDEQSTFRPTAVMEKVSRRLEAEPEQSTTQITTAVGSRKATVIGALEVLVREGFVKQERGKGNAKLYSSLRPYRQHEDPASDRFLPPTPSRRAGTGR